MKRFLIWTFLVLVLAGLAVLPTALAIRHKKEANVQLSVPNPNVVHVNVQPDASNTAGVPTR